MGKRGPQPGSGGRPRKALADKLLEGNPGRRKLKVMDLPALVGADMPEPKEYLTEKQKSGKLFYAEEIYKTTWEWLQKRKCEELVTTQELEEYAMSAARWIQCEQSITEFGFLAKHPITGNAIPSPFVAISHAYMKQTNRLWSQIYQIVRENCARDYKGQTPQDDVMERLLSARCGRRIDRR